MKPSYVDIGKRKMAVDESIGGGDAPSVVARDVTAFGVEAEGDGA